MLTRMIARCGALCTVGGLLIAFVRFHFGININLTVCVYSPVVFVGGVCVT